MLQQRPFWLFYSQEIAARIDRQQGRNISEQAPRRHRDRKCDGSEGGDRVEGACGKGAPGGCAVPGWKYEKTARTRLRATRHLSRSQLSSSPAPVRLRGEITGGDWPRG